jgi:hypothetical protein
MGYGMERKMFITGIAASGALVACGGKGTTPPAPTAAPTATPSAGPTGTPTVAPTATPTAAPTAVPTVVPGTTPISIVNTNPAMANASINVYIYGQVPGTTGAGTVWQFVNLDGSLTTMTAGGPAVPALPFYPGGSGSGTSSQPFHLPPMQSGRIYIAAGALTIKIPVGAAAGAGPNPPAPWTLDGTQSIYFDFVEYTWLSTASAFDVDTTQVDAFSLSMSVTLAGASTQTTGFLSGSASRVRDGMAALVANWQPTLSQWPYRIIHPSHALAGSSFLDPALQAVWNAYKAPTWLTVNSVAGDGGTYATLSGQVDASGNFNFYLSQAGGTPVATILSPFSAVNQSAHGWDTATVQMLACNGAFVYDGSSPDKTALATLGNKISSALNRGVFGTATTPVASEEDCTSTDFYRSAAYQDEYANVVHAIAKNPTYGFDRAYAYAYDDQCGFSTNITDPSPQSVTVNIWPS